MVHELKPHPRIGQHRPEDRDAVEEVEHGCRQAPRDLRVGEAVDEQRRVGPGDDAWAEDVRLGRASVERL